MTEPYVVPVVDGGLGNSAYLVDLGDGRALVVDPSRDQRAMHLALSTRGLRVAYAADTHLHADFLSGARQVSATDGATVLASAAGQREFDHTGLRDGDEVDLGGLRLRAWGTPGHTDEHLSFLLLDGDRPLGVFTGGSLLVGAVARTDLVDPARAEDLARHCCVVWSQAMRGQELGPCAGQMAGLSSSSAVANRNSGVASTASS